MSIKLACLNMRCLSDWSKVAALLRHLSFDVDVSAVQETHLVCDFDARVLSIQHTMTG